MKKKSSIERLNLAPIKTKDENGKEIILGYIPIPKPKDWYIFKNGRRYLNDKYF